MHNTNLTELPTVSDHDRLESNNLSFQLQERLQSLISAFELELTANQQKAITKLWQFIHSPNHFFLLAGYAGYLIQEINNKQQQQRSVFLRNVNFTCYKNEFLQRSQYCIIST